MLPHDDLDNKSMSSFRLTDQTRELLRILWRDGAYGGYCQFDPTYTQWMRADQVEEPLERLQAGNSYLFVHPTNQRGTDAQRSSIATIAAINCLYAEWDVKDFGSRDAILAHLETLPRYPNVLVDSGGGYHGYWLLDTAFLLTNDAARTHAKRLQRAWVQFVGGDDAAKDIARVLRLPGTLNLKPERQLPDGSFPRVHFHESCMFDRRFKLAELEGLCAHILEPKRTATPVAPVAHRNGNGAPGRENHRADAYATKALQEELDELARTPEGHRNNRLNTAAFNLGQLVSEGSLDEHDTEQQLISAGVAAGLPESGTRATVRSGLAAGKRAEPRRTPDFADNGKQQRPMNGATPTTPTAAAPEPEQAEQPSRRFQFMSAAQLLNLPPRQWLVYPLIGVRDMAMVFGESGKGKTLAVIDLLLSCALGQRFADYFEVDEAIRVAYCAGEGGGGIAARFQAAIASRQADPALLERNLTVCLDVPNLFEPGGGLYQFADDWRASGRDKLDLLVIDTLHSATAGANENSTQDASKILASLRFLQKELGCAVLLVHHANRAGTGERGSSAFRAAMDVIVEVAANGDSSVMRCSKLKDGTPFPPLAFSLVAKEDSVRVFWQGQATQTAPQGEEREAQDAALSFLRANPGMKFKCSTIGEGIGQSRQRTNQIMAKLHERERVQRETVSEGKLKTLLYWVVESESERGVKEG